jgi:hypothetical protein
MQGSKSMSMKLRSRQTGLGAIGWLIVLAIASFLLTCFFKVGPVYLDYWSAKKSLDNTINGNAGKPKSELLKAVDKQLEVDGINVIKTKDFKFNQTRDGLELNASYEQRVPLIANVDVVVKFENLKYSLTAPQ